MTSVELSRPKFMLIDGLRIRYVRSNEASGTPVLLTSPWPEGIYAFRGIWKRLAERAPIIAVDTSTFEGMDGADIVAASVLNLIKTSARTKK